MSHPMSPYLTPDEAAAYLRVSARTLANLRWSGKGGPKYAKHGMKVVYRVEDLTAWSEAQSRLSSSDVAVAT